MRSRRKLILRGAALLLAGGTAGWAYYDAPSFWAAADTATSLASRLMQSQSASPPPVPDAAPKLASTDTDAPAAPPMEAAAAPSAAIAAPPDVAAAAGATAAPAEDASGTETAADSAPLEPLPPPPPVSELDADQRRAAAAGLHTDLSQALLKSLTAADYRNAAIAVRMALDDPDDAKVHVWPKQAKAGAAQFQVHFVRGARGCRRYVVLIGRKGWSTTAQPLERCGLKAGTGKTARKAAR